MGSGQCGTLSLARLLSRQPGVVVSHEDPPLLPWQRIGFCRRYCVGRGERLRVQVREWIGLWVPQWIRFRVR